MSTKNPLSGRKSSRFTPLVQQEVPDEILNVQDPSLSATYCCPDAPVASGLRHGGTGGVIPLEEGNGYRCGKCRKVYLPLASPDRQQLPRLVIKPTVEADAEIRMRLQQLDPEGKMGLIQEYEMLNRPGAEPPGEPVDC
jgi:hypothetical protein